MTPNRVDIRNCTLCVVVAMAALLLAWPFADFPFNDDWTWALTVKRLNLTGHLTYNGWSSPSVIAQAYWGLLWVKAFGFSFNVLRISTLPMAAGCVAVSYGLGRRAGLNGALSVFAALTLGLSPLFMPMESTFMSDVPGMFFLLVSMYALLRGYDTKSIGWILAGALIALVGGSSRQVVWIVPLMMLPYFIWLRRGDRAFTIAAIAGWIGVFAGALWMQHWFSRQPFSMPDPPAVSYLRQAIRHPKGQVLSMFWVGLEMMLLLLPITAAVLWPAAIRKFVFANRVGFGANESDAMRPRRREAEGISSSRLPSRSSRLRGRISDSSKRMIAHLSLGVGLFIVLLGITHHYNRMMMPWMQNIITSSGVLGSSELSGDRPVVLTHPIRHTAAIIVFAATSMLLSPAILWMIRSSAPLKTAIDFFLKPAENRVAVQAMVLITFAYLGLELTRCIFKVEFDRHLLPLIPLMGIPILLAFQHGGLARMPALCWAVLLIFGIYGVATTQDLDSLARARVQAIARLRAGGVRNTQIDAGFEHGYWTEADEFGHINDARLRVPSWAYDPSKGPTPHLDFLYRLERQPTAATTRTAFGQVNYFSLLPPFHLTVFIDQLVDPKQRRPSRQWLPKILIDQYQK